mgnify:CR=1 FL=1
MKRMKKPERKSRLSFRDRSERYKQMRRKQSDTSQTRSGFQNCKDRAKSLTANYQKRDPRLHRLCQDLFMAGLQSDSSQKNRSPLQCEKGILYNYIWLMWLLNIVQVPMKRFCMYFHQDDTKNSHCRDPFWTPKRRRRMLAKIKTKDVGGV